MGAQSLMSGLQSSDRLFAGNRREGIEKFVEAMAAFQIIDEIPKRYPRSDEHRGAAQNSGMAVDDCFASHSDSLRRSVSIIPVLKFVNSESSCSFSCEMFLRELNASSVQYESTEAS